MITTPMELLKIQLQDAGRVAAQLKAAGQVGHHYYKSVHRKLVSALFAKILFRFDVFVNCNYKMSIEVPAGLCRQGN